MKSKVSSKLHLWEKDAKTVQYCPEEVAQRFEAAILRKHDFFNLLDMKGVQEMQPTNKTVFFLCISLPEPLALDGPVAQLSFGVLSTDGEVWGEDSYEHGKSTK